MNPITGLQNPMFRENQINENKASRENISSLIEDKELKHVEFENTSIDRL